MRKSTAMMTFFFIIYLVGCCGSDSSGCADLAEALADLASSSSSSSSASSSPPTPALIIQINTTTTVITFNLSDNNIGSLSTIQSKITIRKGGFTGSNVSFTVVQISPTQYNLQGFVLSSGAYFITFESGAFQSSTVVSQAGAISFSI
ncbi:MAG TPA: hypothetical protein ENI73_07700 [Spirochaetes bacterium]|mgnify:CR=1 FL=1|nr:hypothetical protein [Spirochaetota bacterium]